VALCVKTTVDGELTAEEAIPRIEYMFDIGSASSRLPSGMCGRNPRASARMGTAYGTAEADPARSSIFPEQAAGTAVPAAASRGLSLMLACLQQKPDGPAPECRAASVAALLQIANLRA